MIKDKKLHIHAKCIDRRSPHSCLMLTFQKDKISNQGPPTEADGGKNQTPNKVKYRALI